jgi:hypothetical protein
MKVRGDERIAAVELLAARRELYAFLGGVNTLILPPPDGGQESLPRQSPHHP